MESNHLLFAATLLFLTTHAHCTDKSTSNNNTLSFVHMWQPHEDLFAVVHTRAAAIEIRKRMLNESLNFPPRHTKPKDEYDVALDILRKEGTFDIEKINRAITHCEAVLRDNEVVFGSES